MCRPPTLVDIGLFPAHGAGGVIFRRIEPDALVSGLHQLRDGFTRSHVDLEFAAAQLIPEMLAQRRLANLKLSSYLGLGDTKGRSALDQRAMGIGRHIFGWHFTFPIAQLRDARALYEKWRMGMSAWSLAES